tara:strand:- start:1917 stop:2342 length:426 start_codon:yes stop_codon:yes gene_type:complete
MNCRFSLAIFISSLLILSLNNSCSIFQKNKWEIPNYPDKSKINIEKRYPSSATTKKVLLMGQAISYDANYTVIGAKIFVSNNKGTATDLEGKFSLECEAGELNIQASYMGHYNVEKIIKAKPGEIIELLIKFSPSEITWDE